MSSPEQEDGSANVHYIDMKKNTLRKAILMLAYESKGLDEHLNAAKICFHKSLADFEMKQKYLIDIGESLKLQSAQLEREKEDFRLFQQKELEGYERKREQMSVTQRLVEEKFEEVKLREERLIGLLGKIEMETNEFKKLYAQEGRLIEGCGEKLNAKKQELDSKEEQVEVREQRLTVIENQNEELSEKFRIQAQELKAKEKEVEVREEKLKEFGEKLNLQAQEHNAAQEFIKEQVVKLDTKREELDSKEKQVKDREELINIKDQELDAKQKSMDIWDEELRSREEKINSCFRMRPAYASPYKFLS